MDDNSDRDQDQKPENNEEESIESLLSDVDALLAEEDPEFLTKIDTIRTDIPQHGESDIESHYFVNAHIESDYKIYLRRPFEFSTNPKVVAGFWVFIILAIALLIFAWVNRVNLLHEDLFIPSLEKIGSQTMDYNPLVEAESFYDNPRFTKNLITISPLHVNLRPSENSGDNPMLAIEVTVEGLSADAIIEIKDRQAEFKDLLSVHTQSKNYDELLDKEGKRALTEQYRDLLNANLTNGQVRRVLLKTFIIKP